MARPKKTEPEKILTVLPDGWKSALAEAAGDEPVSQLIREAIRREYKRRTKRELPGEVATRGRPAETAAE